MYFYKVSLSNKPHSHFLWLGCGCIIWEPSLHPTIRSLMSLKNSWKYMKDRNLSIYFRVKSESESKLLHNMERERSKFRMCWKMKISWVNKVFLKCTLLGQFFLLRHIGFGHQNEDKPSNAMLVKASAPS